MSDVDPGGSVTRRIVSVNLDNVDDLPRRCRACVFWELDPLAADQAAAAGDTAFEKEAWISAALLEWGSCGKVAYLDRVPVGFLLYAPPAYVPRAMMMPTGPASADAALLMGGLVLPDAEGAGLWRALVSAAAKDLARRGIRALEAFGDHDWRADACMVPTDALTAVGFKTVAPHERWPRLRLELVSLGALRSEVEIALDRLVDPEMAIAARGVVSGSR
jgi:GNAT superfamily N-acetyltransferase